MSKPNFRAARLEDASLIAEFQIAMAWETESLRLEKETCHLGVRAVFESPHRGKYHVCEVDGNVVGSLLLTTEWSDWRNGVVWWMHSVYLRPEFRGQKLFSGFYKYVQELAHAEPSVRGIRLYVDHSNQNAQKVYAKIGMNGEHYRLFEWMKTF